MDYKGDCCRVRSDVVGISPVTYGTYTLRTSFTASALQRKSMTEAVVSTDPPSLPPDAFESFLFFERGPVKRRSNSRAEKVAHLSGPSDSSRKPAAYGSTAVWAFLDGFSACSETTGETGDCKSELRISSS